MKVYFLSDLHLEKGDSPAAERFARLLTELRSGDVLVLGGDIFDLLVGNKALFRARYREVLDALSAAGERGVVIHYLEGNHDFHFAGMFAGFPGVVVHTEDFEIKTSGGHRIFVSHGDLIDEDDTGYRFLRAFTKNPIFAAFVRVLPGRAVHFIGSRSSGASRKYTTGRVENEGTDRLRRLYLDFARGRAREGYQHVLLGHSHLRDLIALEGGSEYVNLGFSSIKLLYAVLDDSAAGSRFEPREIC